MSAPVRQRAGIPIHALPAVVTEVIERAGGSAPPKLAMAYLRVKPGRGLAAVYRTVPRTSGVADHPPMIYLSIDETGLEGVRARSLSAFLRGAGIEGAWPGVVAIPSAGLVLQSFPTDRRLPALVAACDLHPGSPAFAALEAAAVEEEDSSAVRLLGASVTPLRYKPGDRCVLRYRLELEAGSRRSDTTVIGKVYRDPREAERIHGLLDRMHDSQSAQTGAVVAGVRLTSPLVPRPLAVVSDLGLTLNEDVRRPGVGVVTGTDALGPRPELAAIPEQRLGSAAVALARLHTGSVNADPEAVRTPDVAASRALARAERLREYAPEAADRALAIAEALGRCLRATTGAPALPAHGSFKPAQLLFREGDEVVVTDFDQFCRAEPALDVGYFLAYLRPSSLWHGKRGARAWFSRAASGFTEPYREAMTALGAEPSVTDGALERAALYEAALVFKIANRRPNRLNSIRPHELGEMLAEADGCLAGRRR